MLLSVVGLIRITLQVALVSAALAIMSMAALPHVLPPLGRTPIVVRQASSVPPSIATGSLLIVTEVDPGLVAVGDPVAFRNSDGDLMVDQVASTADYSRSGFTLMGHQRGSTLPASIPQAAIEGRVEAALPAVGEGMTMLASTGGAVVALLLIGVLMLLIWVTEDAITTLRKSTVKPVPGAGFAL